MSLQFRTGAVLKSSDGVNQTEIEIPETDPEVLARQEREKKLQGHKTLAEQLAEKREREEEELRERNRHKPTVPLDEVDVEFLAAKKREAILAERRRRELEEADRAEYELAVAAAKVLPTPTEGDGLVTSTAAASSAPSAMSSSQSKVEQKTTSTAPASSNLAFSATPSVRELLAAKRLKKHSTNNSDDVVHQEKKVDRIDKSLEPSTTGAGFGGESNSVSATASKLGGDSEPPTTEATSVAQKSILSSLAAYGDSDEED